jgi:hypothetical protein
MPAKTLQNATGDLIRESLVAEDGSPVAAATASGPTAKGVAVLNSCISILLLRCLWLTSCRDPERPRNFA